MIYLTLYWEFFLLGLFAIGGAHTAIPFLVGMTERHDWFTEEIFSNMIAISEVAPGPIALRMSMYAGYQAAGFLGSLIATMGLVTTGVTSIFILVKFLRVFSTNRFVQYTFYGLRPVIVALIAVATLQIARMSFANMYIGISLQSVSRILPPLILLIVLFVANRKFERFTPLMMIATAAIVGIIFGVWGIYS